MAKALKIAGAVVAVAGLALVTGGLAAGASLSFVLSASSGIAGLTVSGLFTASALLNAGTGLLSPKPKAPSTSSANADRLTVSINTRAPRVTVVGSTATATDLRDQEWSADQSILHRFIVTASHRMAAIREIWFDDKLAWTSAGGVQSAYAGYLTVVPVLEGGPANAINIGARMGASRRYTGCAYVYLRFKLTGNGKKAESPFASAVPSRVTIVGDGAPFYDPRLDSNVPGGSGAMRPDDQTTWRWNASACRNPALAMLFYLLGWRIQNPTTGAWKLAVGKGIPASRIDLASFITAANLCDETVMRADGTTEPRYRCDGVWNENDDTGLVLDNLKATMNALLDDVDGKIRVTVLHNDLAAPIGTLTAADVQGAFTWNQTPALNDCINVIRGGYTDASSTSLYQLVDFPEVRIDSPDGIDRSTTVNLPLVQSPSQAHRLVKQRLQRSQYPGTFSATFLSTAWKFQKGDVIRFSFFPLGWENKLFRIADTATQVNGTVPMVLREEHADLYAFDATEVGQVQGAAPTTYDPALWPIVLGIQDAGKSADWDGVTGPGKPEDGATVGATLGQNVKNGVGEILNPAEVLNSAISLRADGTLIATIGDTVRPLGTLNLPDLGAASDAARRQLESDLASLSAAVAQLATGQQIVQNVFRDAGLYTDPASGVAKLFAVESRAEQIAKLSVSLNAALASIDLKATVNYVDQAVLKAKLEGSAVDLSSIFVRLTSAETSISGLQASIQLKADATIVTGLQGSVTNIQQSLDALNAVISSKASQTVVDRLGQRLTLAEQVISAFDGAAVTTSVTAARRAPADIDVGGANSILALLGGYDAKVGELEALATAKTELRALTDGNTGAIAALGVQLGVQIGAVSALVSSEQQARIAGDTATASDLSSYKASTNTALGTINQSLVTQAGQMSAFSGSLNSLSTTVGDHTTTLNVYGQSIDGLRAKWGVEFNSDGAVTGFALNNNAGRTDATFVVNRFKIAQPNGAGALTVFSIADDGVVEMPNVRVGYLKAKSVTADNIVPGAVLRVSVQVLQAPVGIPWG